MNSYEYTEHVEHIFNKYNIDINTSNILVSILLNNFDNFYKLSDANKKLTVKNIIDKIYKNYDNRDVEEFIGTHYLFVIDSIYYELIYIKNKEGYKKKYTFDITKDLIKCVNELQCFLFNDKESIVLNENSLNYIPNMLYNGYYGYNENGEFDQILMEAQLFEKLYFAHIFQDGNKRSALMILLFYMFNNNIVRRSTIDDLMEFIGNDVTNNTHITMISENERIKKLYQLLN